MLAGTENFTKVTVKSKWVLANASKNTTFCSFSGKGSNLFRLLLCSHKKRRTTYFNWKTFSAFLFPTNAAFQKSQIQTELSAFASLPLQKTKIKGGGKRTQRLFSLHRKSISLSRVHTSVLHLFNRFPWDQFPQNLSTWIQRLGRHCHSYGIFSSPQASPGRGRARPAPAPLPRQRCGDTRTPAQTHTPNQFCLLCPRGQRCPNSYHSDHCCFSPGFLRTGWSVCPGEAISRQRVAPRPLPRGRGTGAGSWEGWPEAGPEQQRSGALPENDPGRSRESPRSGRAAVGAGA